MFWWIKDSEMVYRTANQGADCDSDHNPVVAKMKIRLLRVKNAKKTVKWNVNNLKKPEVRNAYRMRLDQ